MNTNELETLKQAFESLSASREQFLTDAEDLLAGIESTCHEIEVRATWVEERLEEIQSNDTELVEKIATEIDRVNQGDDSKVEQMIEDLAIRLDKRADAEVEANKVGELKKQNARLAAELKLVKGRNSQLAQTVESQQALIDREHSMTSELSLLRQTLDTHRQLLAAAESEPAFDDDVLEEALAELDD